MDQRFLDNTITEPNTGCWLWLGAVLWDGYGLVKRRPKQIRAHRYSWKLHFGEIPAELWVLHKCDQPSCVNPRHLFLGTNLDNQQDAKRKGRLNFERKFLNGNALKTHCKHGHLFDDANTYVWAKRPNERNCRACNRI